VSRKKREIYDDLPPRSDPNYMKLYREKHKDRMNTLTKKWYEKKVEDDPDFWKKRHDPKSAAEYRVKNKKYYREHAWKRQGIVNFTYEQYLIELQKQENRCLICENVMSMPQVDHDHNTGKYRGILCKSCNFGLGTYEKHRDKFHNYLTKDKKFL
jgi:hypothetical protein